MISSSDIYKKMIQNLTERNFEKQTKNEQITILLQELAKYTAEKIITIVPKKFLSLLGNKLNLLELLGIMNILLNENMKNLSNEERIFQINNFFTNYLHFLNRIIAYIQQTEEKLLVLQHNRSGSENVKIVKNDLGIWVVIEINKEYKDKYFIDVILKIVEELENSITASKEIPKKYQKIV